MSFPLTIGPHQLASPPELAELVGRDADVGGLVVEGQRPSAWLVGLWQEGQLTRDDVLALGAGMLRQPVAGLITEGARLAEALHPSPLGPLVVAAAGAHDPLVLLQVDPALPERSVEDTLLRASVLVGDHSDRAARRSLLRRLRHAGLPDLEGEVLLPHGEVEELRRWWPALQSEGVPEAVEALVAARIAKGDDGGQWLAARHPGARTIGR